MRSMTVLSYPSVGHGGGAVLVDEVTGFEAVEGVGDVERVGLVVGDGVGEGQARRRGALEPAGAPTAVDVEAIDLGLRHDRRGVEGDVDIAAPGAQHMRAGEDREQFDRGGQLLLDDVEAASLAEAVVGVDTGAQDEFALVRLRDVDVDVVGHDHGRADGFEELGDQRLQRVGLDRQTDAGHLGQPRGVAGPGQGDCLGGDRSAVRLHADDLVADAFDAGDLAVLDDVDAHLISLAGERLRDVIVLGDAGPRLEGRSHDRVAQVVADVDDRADLLDLGRVEPFGVDAVECVRVHPPLRIAHVLEGVGEVEHAALGEQEVVVEFVRQLFPELEGGLVDRRRFVPEVVRADDRRVPGHVSPGQPAALDDRDVPHPVVLRQVVGGGQAVSAAAADDVFVGLLRFGVVPQEVGVFGQEVSHQRAPISEMVGYSGWVSARRVTRSLSSAMVSGLAPVSSVPAMSASAMMSATSAKAAEPKPRLARAGVPIRSPEVTMGGRGSSGTALRLTVMPMVASRSSAWAPSSTDSRRSTRTRWTSVPPVSTEMPRSATSSSVRRRASSAAPARVRFCLSMKVSVAASPKATALPAMTCSSGPPCWPGKTAELIFFAISVSSVRMMPPRGPPRVLCVVEVTTWACGTGEGWRPAATSPAKWAMST